MSRGKSRATEGTPTQAKRWDWPARAAMPALPPGEAHVWVASLERPPGEMRNLWETLSVGERERAKRCRSARKRQRFVAGRAMLRALLGHYLARPPASVALAYTPRGKPHLAPDERLDAAGTALHFNLSHAEDTVLYAFARGRQLGIDIERIRPSPAHRAIAGRFFAPDEVQRLETAPREGFTAAFVACWVRKEACLKAVGAGLALPMREVVVPTRRIEGSAFGIELPGFEGPRRWTGHDLAGLNGYAASLVMEGDVLRISRWEWACPPGASGAATPLGSCRASSSVRSP